MVPERTVLTLEFPAGLAELTGESCPKGPRVSVSTTKSDATVKAKGYCKGGTVSRLELFGVTAVSVEVPKEEEMEGTAFTVKAKPRGQSLSLFGLETEKIFTFYLRQNVILGNLTPGGWL